MKIYKIIKELKDLLSYIYAAALTLGLTLIGTSADKYQKILNQAIGSAPSDEFESKTFLSAMYRMAMLWIVIIILTVLALYTITVTQYGIVFFPLLIYIGCLFLIISTPEPSDDETLTPFPEEYMGVWTIAWDDRRLYARTDSRYRLIRAMMLVISLVSCCTFLASAYLTLNYPFIMFVMLVFAIISGLFTYKTAAL